MKLWLTGMLRFAVFILLIMAASACAASQLPLQPVQQSIPIGLVASSKFGLLGLSREEPQELKSQMGRYRKRSEFDQSFHSLLQDGGLEAIYYKPKDPISFKAAHSLPSDLKSMDGNTLIDKLRNMSKKSNLAGLIFGHVRKDEQENLHIVLRIYQHDQQELRNFEGKIEGRLIQQVKILKTVEDLSERALRYIRKGVNQPAPKVRVNPPVQSKKRKGVDDLLGANQLTKVPPESDQQPVDISQALGAQDLSTPQVALAPSGGSSQPLPAVGQSCQYGLIPFSWDLPKALVDAMSPYDQHEIIEKALQLHLENEINGKIKRLKTEKPIAFAVADAPPVTISPGSDPMPIGRLKKLTTDEKLSGVIFGHIREDLSEDALHLVLRVYHSNQSGWDTVEKKVERPKITEEEIDKRLKEMANEARPFFP